eukprot:GHVS01024804.1.p2 GENE.GHVS01024804.1~~GHVS01024804.1.p2  ORF type:complete len:103 (+),score=7.82 GHVS01024804.1:45-311(+)
MSVPNIRHVHTLHRAITHALQHISQHISQHIPQHASSDTSQHTSQLHHNTHVKTHTPIHRFWLLEADVFLYVSIFVPTKLPSWEQIEQ